MPYPFSRRCRDGRTRRSTRDAPCDHRKHPQGLEGICPGSPLSRHPSQVSQASTTISGGCRPWAKPKRDWRHHGHRGWAGEDGVLSRTPEKVPALRSFHPPVVDPRVVPAAAEIGGSHFWLGLNESQTDSKRGSGTEFTILPDARHEHIKPEKDEPKRRSRLWRVAKAVLLFVSGERKKGPSPSKDRGNCDLGAKALDPRCATGKSYSPEPNDFVMSGIEGESAEAQPYGHPVLSSPAQFDDWPPKLPESLGLGEMPWNLDMSVTSAGFASIADPAELARPPKTVPPPSPDFPPQHILPPERILPPEPALPPDPAFPASSSPRTGETCGEFLSYQANAKGAAPGARERGPTNQGTAPSRSEGPSRKRRRTESGRDEDGDNCGGGGDGGDDNDGDDSDEKGNGRRGGSGGGGGPPSGPPGAEECVACPFSKVDPDKFGRCLDVDRKKVSHIKMHIYKCHFEELACDRCSEVLGSKEAYDEHLVANPPCPEFPHDRITHDMREKLKKGLRGPAIEQWKHMFRTIFPGKPVPSSPYKDYESDIAFRYAQRQRPGSSEWEALRQTMNLDFLPGGQFHDLPRGVVDVMMRHVENWLRGLEEHRVAANRDSAVYVEPTNMTYQPQQDAAMGDGDPVMAGPSRAAALQHPGADFCAPPPSLGAVSAAGPARTWTPELQAAAVPGTIGTSPPSSEVMWDPQHLDHQRCEPYGATAASALEPEWVPDAPGLVIANVSSPKCVPLEAPGMFHGAASGDPGGSSLPGFPWAPHGDPGLCLAPDPAQIPQASKELDDFRSVRLSLGGGASGSSMRLPQSPQQAYFGGPPGPALYSTPKFDGGHGDWEADWRDCADDSTYSGPWFNEEHSSCPRQP